MAVIRQWIEIPFRSRIVRIETVRMFKQKIVWFFYVLGSNVSEWIKSDVLVFLYRWH